MKDLESDKPQTEGTEAPVAAPGHGLTSSLSSVGVLLQQVVRIFAVLLIGFLTLYFCDSSTRLFVKHALAYDSLFFGGVELGIGFLLSLCSLILLLRYFSGIWSVLAVMVAFTCMLIAESAFRITGVPLNNFQINLAMAAHGDKWNVWHEFHEMILKAAWEIAWMLLVGVVCLKLIRWRPSRNLVSAFGVFTLLVLGMGRPDFDGQVFVPSPIGLPLVTAKTMSDQLFRVRGPVTLPLQQPAPLKHFFYIVDETVRADHISVNNREIGVTPWLADFSSVTSLGAAVSVANCSVQTQYLLRTGVVPEEIPDIERSTLSKPNIFAFAKKAGRKPYFIDAQSKGFTNYMSEHDLVDTSVEMGLFGEINDCTESGECLLVRRLRELGSSAEKNFAYVVKAAAHWPYELRYPASQQKFKPVVVDGVRDPVRVANSYRNALRWNVDLFFKELLGDGTIKDYLIIYTGDHGEDLSPGPQRSPHCGHHDKVRPIEGVVPILLFTDRPELKSVFAQVAKLRHDRTSQYDIFPSWLIFFGYERQAVYNAYGPSIFDAKIRPARFYWGDIFHDYGGFQTVAVLTSQK